MINFTRSAKKQPHPKVRLLKNYLYYSERRATTGSFLEAMPEGIRPAMSVSPMLMATKITPATGGSTARMLSMSVTTRKMRLIGRHSKSVVRIPMAPAAKPMISVSALNTREISRFEAPIARRIPISLVRSSTEI